VNGRNAAAMPIATAATNTATTRKRSAAMPMNRFEITLSATLACT
jgi:hypothetical protein